MKKILIVEDDPSRVELYQLLFKRFKNIMVYTAPNGNEGLEKAGQIKPDLIILDNRMPGLPGEMVAKKLKSNPETKSIPVIMSTSMKFSPEQINLIKLDVDDFIQHPFSPWDLQQKTEKFLGPLTEETVN